ncbi:copper transporter [uncultured Jatrophihabitans sp.]|uniref:copper transporter n=1 Tax=uncultured Jatrophihabitans sp. TaxID=1610747 RepID=UPI0035C97F10
MISFRYHLVSIVAIFLALALGIVVGTTALSGPITKDLRNQLDDAKNQRDALAGQVKTLQGQLDDAGEFASTYGSQLVAGSLTKQPVLVIALPGVTSGMQSGIIREVSAAGGKVGGVVTVTRNYFDPRLGSGIASLATGGARPIDWTAPETSDPGQLGGSLLAWVLSGKGQATDITQVLGAFAALHMVTTDGTTITPAADVLVLSHGAKPAGAQGTVNSVALISALARDGAHVVVAGNAAAAGRGGLVAAVRTEVATRSAVSSVDNADNALGQVSAVLALSAAAKGDFGHYGTQNGADALFPTPSR